MPWRTKAGKMDGKKQGQAACQRNAWIRRQSRRIRRECKARSENNDKMQGGMAVPAYKRAVALFSHDKNTAGCKARKIRAQEETERCLNLK